ncbi:MAG: DUF5676 family membrane protein [bacterium]|nr:DUF5676 family membrane protein [bacterium]
MLDTKALANAAAVVALILYFACLAIFTVSPNFLFNMMTPSMHGVNLEPLRPTGMNINPTNIITGLIVWVGGTWLVFWAFGYFYNQLKGGKK